MKKNLLVFITFITLAASAQTNYAINFNGSNQYASIGSPLSNNTSYTKEAWVYSTDGTGSRNIISSNAAPFWLNGGILTAGHGGQYYLITDPTVFPLNVWVHVALTYDAATTTMRLYRDGNLVNSNMSVSSNYANEPIYIGSHNAGSSLFKGSIDEVRIWNLARTQAQIKENLYKGPVATASGLVSYYKFNEGAGSTATNFTGGLNGNLQNSPSWVASPVMHSANALNLDGVNDQVILPKIVNSDFTVEYWMKTTQTAMGGGQWYSGNGIVDAEMPGGTNDWGTALLANKLAFGLGLPDLTIISTTPVNTGNWVHVAASWKQSTGEMKLYINGLQEATAFGSTNLRTAPSRIVLGALQTNLQYYNGSIDELRIWNEVRTPAQVLANMNKELVPSDETTLAASYNFNQGLAAGSNTGLTTLPDLKSTNNGVLVNFALNGTTSNFVAQNNSLIILPLQWLSFTVHEQDQKVSLNWSTANEQNTRSFIIQHSTNGTVWVNAGSIAAAGKSNATLHYSFTHTSPADGINYYRILQTDIDGRSSYSIIRSLHFNKATLPLIVLTNPVGNGTLQVKLNKPAMLSMHTSEGKRLWQKQTNPGIESINISTYAKGIYLLKANDQTEKIVVQ